MPSSPLDKEIELILEKIQNYKKIERRKINKRQVILDIRDELIKQNYPTYRISTEIVKILKDYDISERYILMVLDSRYKSPEYSQQNF